jgi:hypothetical protein
MKKFRTFFGLTPLKRVILGAAVLAVLAVLGSCIGTGDPVVFDDALPPEETAKINFFDLLPTSYNGIPVDKKKWRQANIPQGEALFVVDINTGYTTGKDFAFSFTFEGGKEYLLIYGTDDDDDDLYGVFVYNSPWPVLVMPSRDKIIAFVPFLNQPDSVTTSYR